jgi:hypothetical protein
MPHPADSSRDPGAELWTEALRSDPGEGQTFTDMPKVARSDHRDDAGMSASGECTSYEIL